MSAGQSAEQSAEQSAGHSAGPDPVLAGRAGVFAELARANIVREYPNAPQHLLAGPAELVPPRTYHPAFYGAYDWHSSVHMHWLLVRLLRRYGEHVGAATTEVATAALDAHLTPEGLTAEAAYLRRHPSFERPYGWAWLLALTSESAALAAGAAVRPPGAGKTSAAPAEEGMAGAALTDESAAHQTEPRSPESAAQQAEHRSPESTAHAVGQWSGESTALGTEQWSAVSAAHAAEHHSPASTTHAPGQWSGESAALAAERWYAALRPAADTVAELVLSWLRKATYPVRHGTHVNSAFALGLILDSAQGADVPELWEPVATKIQEWYVPDHGAATRWEPSGQDFLSPLLCEADAVRRVLPSADFAEWLARFLPELDAPGTGFLPPPRISDPADPQIGHLFGLCLSRAAALRSLAGALPETDPRARTLTDAAEANLAAALPATTSGDFTTDHWLATFATLALDGTLALDRRP